MNSNEAAGVIFVENGGNISFHSGVGSEMGIRSLVTRNDWITEMRDRRITSLTFNGEKLILVCYPTHEGFAVLIHTTDYPAFYSFVASVNFAFDIFNHLLSDPYDAMTVVDETAKLRYISPIHERFFGLKQGEGYGKDVRKVIENTRLDQVVKGGKSEVGQLQSMKGSRRVVTRTPILRKGRVVGAIGRVMFSGPSQLEEMNSKINALEHEVEFYKREAKALRRNDYGLTNIIGGSAAIDSLKQKITQIGSMDVPVLIQGESGVGKELVAQAIHQLSPRRNKPHVIVNAAALPASLVESELFGYASGAFTGANQRGHAGKFEQANTGTIFLDEIGDMPLDVQAKLLRVLQDNKVERIGGESPVSLDFRLVTATNHNLQEMVEEGGFRLDLFYRISPVILEVPPLRDRLEDIELLADYFLTEFAERHGRRKLKLDNSAVSYLTSQSWPGNVRQLKHEVERAAIFVSGNQLTAANFTDEPLVNTPTPNPVTPAYIDTVSGCGPLEDAIAKLEEKLIRDAMINRNSNKKKVAEDLKISRSHLYKRLKSFGIS